MSEVPHKASITLHQGTIPEMKEEARLIVNSKMLRMQMMACKLTGHKKRRNKELMESIKMCTNDFYSSCMYSNEDESLNNYVIRLMSAGAVIDGLIREIQSI